MSSEVLDRIASAIRDFEAKKEQHQGALAEKAAEVVAALEMATAAGVAQFFVKGENFYGSAFANYDNGEWTLERAPDRHSCFVRHKVTRGFPSEFTLENLNSILTSVEKEVQKRLEERERTLK